MNGLPKLVASRSLREFAWTSACTIAYSSKEAREAGMEGDWAQATDGSISTCGRSM